MEDDEILRQIQDEVFMEELKELMKKVQRAPIVDRFKNQEQEMRRKLIDEVTRDHIKNLDGYVRGVVYASKDYMEYGYFKPTSKSIVITVERSGMFGERSVVYGISREALPYLMWSNSLGYYINPSKLSSEDITRHQLVKGQGNFPYQFPKRYEAAESFDIFKGAQEVLEDKEYPLSKHLRYTFGIEFETSMGYIPQEISFRDGLIPLRDGSISGIEYSTVVLEGNKGLNLLRQQCNTLKTFTEFNKECALHIHMGGYPVDPTYIYALYCVWYFVERELIRSHIIPPLSFNTAKYKANGKDYCYKLDEIYSFEDLYKAVTGRTFMGDLHQAHPADVEKRAKWNIKSRYKGLNLVNMLCYKGPKTVEFRFLRPSFNFRKITLWLYILNAVLEYARHYASRWETAHPCTTDKMLISMQSDYCGLRSLLRKVYDEETCSFVEEELKLLQYITDAQTSNGDDCGRDVFFEDRFMPDV